MHLEHTALSLTGDRPENQDRVEISTHEDALLLVVADGMGGHAGGALAAEVATATLRAGFGAHRNTVADPQGFLTLALAQAHANVVRAGHGIRMGAKPRATCAVCLVQDNLAYWAHVGDSRLYLLRDGQIVTRTRDHSHVELLLREGLIAERDVRTHPMRNFVECCLGGDPTLPNMGVASPKRLASGDIILLCTDGLWSGVDDGEIGRLMAHTEAPLEVRLAALAARAVRRNAPHSDNTSAAALCVAHDQP